MPSRGSRLRAWWLAAWLLVSPGLLERDQCRRQLAREVSSVLWLPCVCNCRSCCSAAPCASARPSSSYNKNLTMLSSSSLCPLLPTLSAPWWRQTAARAKQTRLIGTQTPLIKCWLCLGCFIIIRVCLSIVARTPTVWPIHVIPSAGSANASESEKGPFLASSIAVVRH